jgi:hypothetical protein
MTVEADFRVYYAREGPRVAVAVVYERQPDKLSGAPASAAEGFLGIDAGPACCTLYAVAPHGGGEGERRLFRPVLRDSALNSINAAADAMDIARRDVGKDATARSSVFAMLDGDPERYRLGEAVLRRKLASLRNEHPAIVAAIDAQSQCESLRQLLKPVAA